MYAEGQGYGAEELKKWLWELLGREYDAGEEIEDAKAVFRWDRLMLCAC